MMSDEHLERMLADTEASIQRKDGSHRRLWQFRDKYGAIEDSEMKNDHKDYLNDVKCEKYVYNAK